MQSLLRAPSWVAYGLLLALAAGRVHADEGLPVIELTVAAGQFAPQTVHVPARERFKLRVTNKGPGPEEFESTDLNREKIVAPGHSVFVFLGPLAPGTYRFFGDFHVDTAQGVMIAE